MDETNFSSEVAAPGETRAATPSVAAVVVAHDPGEWFDEVVDSIVTQDYPRLTLVVIDHGTVGDLADRVARMAPQALVVRADRTVGFGAAANVARSVGLDSAYLLLCHDDVALASNAVSTLVTESLRSNAELSDQNWSPGTNPRCCSTWVIGLISSVRPTRWWRRLSLTSRSTTQ